MFFGKYHCFLCQNVRYVFYPPPNPQLRFAFWLYVHPYPKCTKPHQH